MPCQRHPLADYADRNRLLREMGFPTYADYLKSDLWKGIREKVYKLKGTACFLCGKPATELHHNSYTKRALAGKKLRHVNPICHWCHGTIEFRGEEKVGVKQAAKQFKKLRRQHLRGTKQPPAPRPLRKPKPPRPVGPGKAPAHRQNRNAIERLEPQFRQQAEQKGFVLAVSLVHVKRAATTFHWMLNTPRGERVVDYWPTTGRWYAWITKEKGVVAHPSEILDLAARLLLSFVR